MSRTQPQATVRRPRTLPLGAELVSTIERLRAIVASSQDALLTEGPVHPDHKLLDLCAEALHLLSAAKAVRHRRDAIHHPATQWTDADRAEDWDLSDLEGALVRQAMRPMRAAAKIPAITASGLYSKALLVRASVSGARVLAKSLANDLIACEALRASLWPMEIV